MRLPVIPTLMVAVMVPAMLGLGVWQLQRAAWKEALLADLASAAELPPLDLDTASHRSANFRRASATCTDPPGRARAVIGKNAVGATGYMYLARCRPGVEAVAGWAARPDLPLPPRALGPVAGTAISTNDRIRLYLGRPAGLPEPAVPPGLGSIPNNHRAYAWQWFAFALTLAVIYGLYLRSRRRQVAAAAASR
jgi:surfeit locus 1 family protein